MPHTIEPRFLFAPDHVNNQLYILHRQFPACLIQVIQTIPVTFRIVDLYDRIPNNQLIKHPFLEDAKQFFRNYGEKYFDSN